MISRFFLSYTILLLCSINMLQAQQTSLSIKTNTPGALVRLITYDDLLNWHGKTLAQEHTDEQGMVSFVVDLDVSKPAHIALDLDRVDLVLKPGASYKLIIRKDLQQGNLSYFDKVPPALIFEQTNDDDLQARLEAVDMLVNSFLIDNFQSLYRLQRYHLLDSLQQMIDQTTGNGASAYTKAYAQYKFAAVILAVKRNGKALVINDYYKDKEVLYRNEPYMVLFSELFSDYLFSNRFLAMESLREMDWKSYLEWRDYLRNDPLLEKDSRLAELIVLASLKHFYRDTRFNRNDVINYLEYLKSNALFEEHRQMAENTINKLLFLAPGTGAPHFELIDQHGKVVKGTDFSNSLVVIQFVNADCPTCEAGLQQMKELLNLIEADIQLITISTADSYTHYQSLFASRDYKWPLLNLGEKILLPEEFNVKTYPELILINRQSKIGMAPAPQEEAALLFHINRLLSN
ncbi:MAG: redoxin domain-containing protein [Bacteroidetes bacterium]|jgi:thiol-disulfide isomerase/thioredoxin|nr:redoxin domain-containing protein [Bacteroidota bacterium]